MTCVHKVRWSVKRPEDCRFRLSVSHYKDRIVAPDEYSGATVVMPSDAEQVLPTKDKTVRANITVNPAPVESLATSENGTFTPSSGNVGFSEVVVDVEPSLESLSVTENGLYLPDSGVDGFDRVSVDVPIPAPVTESLSVTENGTYAPPTGVDGFGEVVVDVPTGGFPSYDDVVLPSEYQRVEFIESSGTQYINLPYGFLPTDFVQIKSAIATSEGPENYMVSTRQWNTNNNRFAMAGIAKSNVGGFGVAIGNKSTTDGELRGAFANDGNIHEFVYRDGLFISPDINSACGFSAENGLIFGSETTNIRLFFGWNSPTKGKIAYFVHEKADNRKIALFACYRKADGVIGMYDVENDVFYTNDGTGDFTKGQDI